MEYKGKVAIVTGSSRGIGKGCAKALLERGAKVCLSGVNEEKGKETLAEFKRLYGDDVIYVRCDVKCDDDMKALFKTTMETFKGLDFVVNNAAIIDEKDWKRSIDTTFGGVIRGTYLAMQYMRTDKGGNGGTIVNVSSLAAFNPVSVTPCYSGCKAGIVNFTRAWASHPDVLNNGIRLVCLSPGYTLTDIVNVDEDNAPGHKAATKMYLQVFTPMSTDEVAGAFIKLLEDDDNNGDSLNVFRSKKGFRMKYAKY